MARTASHWVCQQCGAAFQKWAGRCEACEAWNSLVEEKPVGSVPGGLGKGAGRARRIEIVSLDGAGDPPPAFPPASANWTGLPVAVWFPDLPS